MKEHRTLNMVDLLFDACNDNIDVLKYVHADNHGWRNAIQCYIVATATQPDFYFLKAQWASSVNTILHPFLNFNDVSTVISYNLKMMHRDALFDENEKSHFMHETVAQYETIVRETRKRARTD